MDENKEMEFRPVSAYEFEIVVLFLDKIMPLVKSEFFFHQKIKGFGFNGN